ncbi:hypothetical protein BJ165DRAFT_1504042, partial [Panaeolus papilionaceus]
LRHLASSCLSPVERMRARSLPCGLAPSGSSASLRYYTRCSLVPSPTLTDGAHQKDESMRP